MVSEAILTNSETEAGFDPASQSLAYRRLLGKVPTGVAIATANTIAGPVGMTVGTFTSVSLDPPLITFFVDKGSSTWRRMYESDHFGINVLGHDHQDLCAKFSRPAENRFDQVDFHYSQRGAPLLDNAILKLECTRVKVDLLGDHYQIVGLVNNVTEGQDGSPLIFLSGGFVEM